MKRLVFLLAFLFPAVLFASEPVFERVETPAKKLFIGEVLVYKVEYLGITVGEGRAEVKEKTVINGRPAYHVEVRVRSHGIIDKIYKVRDEHHTYIDAETFDSLAYRKKVNEGKRAREEYVEYDQEKHQAVLESKAGKKFYEIQPRTQDQLSCGYYFRMLSLKPESSVFIPVEADGKNYDMEVRVRKTGKMKIDGIGKFETLEVRPLMQFEGIFFRKGKIRGWISLDNRRIPLKMTVSIPVLGRVKAELTEYIPGKETE